MWFLDGMSNTLDLDIQHDEIAHHSNILIASHKSTKHPPSIPHAQPTQYVTITTRRNSADTTDSAEIEHRVHLKKIVSQLKNNLYNVSVLSEPDLEMITNMDPNSVADITGKDFIEQLKEVSGRLGGGFVSTYHT